MDTVEANISLGFKADHRDYGVGAQILADLGVKRMRLMTNNPKKISGLASYGLEVVEQLPITTLPNKHNRRYLKTKQKKMGHLMEVPD
jgi:3,4-dihydroxy 2-butanone 4-phosphate synthase/GTP cyclohydrolase II